MFVFGHLGIGSKLVSPWSKGLSRKWLLLGCILPDLIDKSLYYGLVLTTGLHGRDLGLISGTRTFAHTAIFALLLALLAWFRRSRLLSAVALGVSSHLLLDSMGDVFEPQLSMLLPDSRGIIALLFPLYGFRFPVAPFRSGLEHFLSLLRPYILISELAGISILFWDYWKDLHQAEILSFLNLKRWARRKKRRNHDRT